MDIYVLCEYGLSSSIVKKLIDNNVSLLDIKILREKALKNVFNENSNNIDQIMNVIDKVKISDDYHSIFELLEYGISKLIVSRLFEYNVTLLDLINNSYKNISEKVSLQEARFEELQVSALKCIKPHNREIKKDYSSFLIEIIKAIDSENSISIIKLKQHLLNFTRYPVDNINHDLAKLRENNLIEYTMDGFKVKYQKLLNYISNNLKDTDKVIILERLCGKTLEEIAQKKGITRERVRQIVAKRLSRMPYVFEDRYKEIFEKYFFTEETFCKIFSLDKTVYFYLKEKFNCGQIDLIDGLKTADFSDNQKKKIYSICKMAKIFGKLVSINRQNILRLLIEEYASNEIRIEDFLEKYNNFVELNKQYELEKIEERSLEGMIYRSEMALFGLGRCFRFFDFDSLNDDDFAQIYQIFNLDDGYYSTLVLFENNKELMTNLDIRNEYELHNFAKNKLGQLDNVIFERMPNFSVNYLNKRDFFKDKIMEMSPISLNDFLESIEKNYGHKSGTLVSYIGLEFKEYIDGNMINANQRSISDELLLKLKELLVKPIYTLKELKKILFENDVNNYSEIVASGNMYKIGYRIRSTYILQKDISSIEEYIMDLVNNQDFISNENFLLNSTYSAMMKKVERNYDIVLISPKEYITIKKLNELGISKEDLYKICNDVNYYFKNEEYFTIHNIKEKINISKIDVHGFDDIFFENLVSNIEGIVFVRASNSKIFSKRNTSILQKDFILDVYDNRKYLLLDELQDEINDKYGIKIEQEKLKNVIISTDLYFSEALNKIYFEKEYYYEEVYNYER